MVAGVGRRVLVDEVDGGGGGEGVGHAGDPRPRQPGLRGRTRLCRQTHAALGEGEVGGGGGGGREAAAAAAAQVRVEILLGVGRRVSAPVVVLQVDGVVHRGVGGGGEPGHGVPGRLLHLLLVDPRLLVPLQVGTCLETFCTQGAEVRPLPCVGVQMLPEMS